MAGHQQILGNNDAAVGVSGKPVRIFSFNIRSTSGGGASVTLYNGTSTAGTKYDEQIGVADASFIVNYGSEGKFFPGGCFVDVDANTQYVDFNFIQVQS